MRKILLILDKFFLVFIYNKHIHNMCIVLRTISLLHVYDSSGNALRNNLGYTTHIAYLTIEVIYAV